MSRDDRIRILSIRPELEDFARPTTRLVSFRFVSLFASGIPRGTRRHCTILFPSAAAQTTNYVLAFAYLIRGYNVLGGNGPGAELRYDAGSALGFSIFPPDGYVATTAHEFPTREFRAR